MAISEFGPGAFIYHEGARYEVNRVSLPAREDGTGVNITEIKRCSACGYLHESRTAARSLRALRCAVRAGKHDDQLMRLLVRQDPPPRPDQRRRGGTPARRA